jgi:hypothetical protein
MLGPLRRLLAAVMRRIGYVRAVDLDDLQVRHDQVRSGYDQMVRALRHSKRDLEHQLLWRARTEREIEFLRQLEIARVNNDTTFMQAVARMDTACGRIESFMEDTWPQAIIDQPDPVTEEAVGRA